MILSLPSGERATAPHLAEDSPSETRPSICTNGPFLGSRFFSRVVVRELGRFGYLALGAGKGIFWSETTKKAPSQAKGLVRVGVCRGGSGHKSNFRFRAVSEVPWIVCIATVTVVGVNKRRR